MGNINSYKKAILVTGGAGFIGSHVVRYLVNKYPDYAVFNLDALTYCGNLENLKDLKGKENYFFEHKSINSENMKYIFSSCKITDVIHLAAESHVDRSMVNPDIFMETNVKGTINLLNIARECWKDDMENHRFINMCTDEIFGSLKEGDAPFSEASPLNPHSPYSTSKTCQYLYGKTYYEAYGVPVISLACGNAIGPNQFPEKLIPLTIDRLINKQEIPIYGEGKQMRDWTNVHDICSAIDLLLHKGTVGELYCIGGDACKKNIDVVNKIIDIYAWYMPKNETESKIDPRLLAIQRATMLKRAFIKHIPDPRGKSHDFRYDLDHSKITNELGWKPQYTFEASIQEVVEWYLTNTEWTEHCKSGEYQKWIETYYNGK